MDLSIISFTKAGLQLSERIAIMLDGEAEVRLYTKCGTCTDRDGNPSVQAVKTAVGVWAGAQMQERNAILFIGACGIAVRAVAPFLMDKLRDVPVLVMDERGYHVIPILSGHMGGANALAYRIAEKTGAEPVITTATDINGKFAVDLFAKKNGLFIEKKEGIVKVSAKVLAGEEVTVSIETGHGCGSDQKSGIRFVPYPPTESVDLVITSWRNTFDAALVLRPKEYVLGIGCKRGKTEKEIGHLIKKIIGENGIVPAQIFALASISRKSQEEGILRWCKKENVPFLTYTAEELREIRGNFKTSAFVEEQVGVDNVCERAALKTCGEGGRLVVQKCAENGVTVAIAKRDWRVRFDEE